jgi:hypothetical protein
MGGSGFVASFDYVRVSRPLLYNPDSDNAESPLK